MAPPCPPLGQRVPDVPHAISVQLPKWQDMIDFASANIRVRSVQKGGYPRSFLNKNVQRVSGSRKISPACTKTSNYMLIVPVTTQVHDLFVWKFSNPDQACLVFPAAEHAKACKSYVCKPDNGLNPQDVQIRSVELLFETDYDDRRITPTGLRLHAVFLPRNSVTVGMLFWRLTGCGVSSRLAEDILEHISTAYEVDADSPSPEWPCNVISDAADLTVRDRVALFLERAPVGGPRFPKVSAEDVFLYPSGMAAIYHLTQVLQGWPGTKSVVFGFPYELTLKMQQDYAKGCVFYGFGTLEESELLEDYLHMLAQNDQCIQAVWCECASNPLLRTVDLDRLRRLADRYGFLVIVDDTIGSLANVDVLSVADVVVTSLTKSFSGLADVMAGSIAVNPRSAHYERLHEAVASKYINRLYGRDAIKLEFNSREYLPRVSQMNNNATALVALLSPFAASPDCPLQRVYYPSTCDWSTKNYEARMRPVTPDFTPGYGGLFTLEFDTVQSSASFFDALHVCKGPSLGAEVTLAQPYVQTVFKDEKSWAAKYGLSETIVRISVGIEDTETLKSIFLDAIKAMCPPLEATPLAHADPLMAVLA